MITIVEYNKETKRVAVNENVDWRKFQCKPGNLYWWDLYQTTDAENACLSEHFHFHPLAIEDTLAHIHHPKVDFYDTYLYIIVHGVDQNLTETKGFTPKELDIFLGPQFLVTFHDDPARSIAELLRRCRENTPIFDYGVDFVLYTMLDMMITNYEPILEDLGDEIDETEEIIFRNPEPVILRKIFGLKRNLIRLRKTVSPQREVVNHLARNEYQIIQQRTQAYFRDVYDKLYRMSEMIESFRDIITSMMETYLSIVSNRLNEVMKVLTIFATIFMPLTVITGIYGMNFKNLPELNWHYGYFMVLGVMGVVVVGMVAYFRSKKWL